MIELAIEVFVFVLRVFEVVTKPSKKLQQFSVVAPLWVPGFQVA